MKAIVNIFLVTLTLSCTPKETDSFMPRFEETNLSFLHLKSGYDTQNNWIKNSENILMMHETFKTIGYHNIIQEHQWYENFNWFLDLNKTPKEFIDSLVITFEKPNISNKYYKDFWLRRKNEMNDSTVYTVVREIQQIRDERLKLEAKIESVNDTLKTLLAYEFPERQLNNKEANSLIKYLIKIGLHQSAYNLLNGENMGFQGIIWDDDKVNLMNRLIRSEVSLRPWYVDDTK